MLSVQESREHFPASLSDDEVQKIIEMYYKFWEEIISWFLEEKGYKWNNIL